MNLRERTLQIAEGYLGVHEVGGDNSGPDVELFLKAANLGRGNPWCAALVNHSAERAANEQGVISPLESVPLQGYVQSYVDYGRKHGWVIPFDSALPGDLFCVHFPSLKRYGHIGFVRKVSPDRKSFTTVEGNSNDEGTREGKEVCCNVRKVTGTILILRWTRVVLEKEAA